MTRRRFAGDGRGNPGAQRWAPACEPERTNQASLNKVKHVAYQDRKAKQTKEALPRQESVIGDPRLSAKGEPPFSHLGARDIVG